MANEKNIQTRIQHKHDIEANWLKTTAFIPKSGELIIYDADENYDYVRIKIGDGATNINELAFVVPTPDWNALENESGYIKNKPATVLYTSQDLTDEQKQQTQNNIGFSVEDALMQVTEAGFVEPVSDTDGSIYTDENGNIYTLI